jgi:voltage-gated potassium channel Kch
MDLAMPPTPPDDNRSVLVVGDTSVARRVCATLRDLDRSVIHLREPGDRDLADACRRGLAAAAVLVRQDVAALRYAMALASLSRELPLSVTVFDRTIAQQLATLLPQATVKSPADLAAPSLAGPCLADDVVAAKSNDGNGPWQVRRSQGRLVSEALTIARPPAWRRALSQLALRLHSHDRGTRLLVVGLTGLLAVLLGDWAWLVAVEGHAVLESFAEATRVVATVGPANSDPSAAYAVLSSVAMLATIVLTAIFTAGAVECLLEPRLLGLVGGRSLPRSGHVVVVGLGQVGIRLCTELRALGVPVVGVERDLQAPHLRLARTLRIPVVIGHGGDRELLEGVRLKHARALAAVGSDDLDNVAVALAAQGVSPTTRVILRAGEQEAIAETKSLVSLGTTRDVTALATAYVVDRLVGDSGSDDVVADGPGVAKRGADGTLTTVLVSAREDCPHSATVSHAARPAPASAPDAGADDRVPA